MMNYTILWFLLLLVIFTVWTIYEKIINYEVAPGNGAKCFLLLATVVVFTEWIIYEKTIN
jgi:hypothetical protein